MFLESSGVQRGGSNAQEVSSHAWLAGEIAQVHKDSGGTYGTLRVTAELRYGRGIHVDKGQVHPLMRRLGIYGLPKRRLPRGAMVGKPTSLDLVRRRFRADRPDLLWMTDITEHPTREGKIYCGAVIDAFSQMVVAGRSTAAKPEQIAAS